MFVGRKNDGGIATPKGSGLGTNPRAHQKGFQSHNDCRCLENAERFQRSLTPVAELWWTRVFCVAIAGNRGGRVDGIDHDERAIDPSGEYERRGRHFAPGRQGGEKIRRIVQPTQRRCRSRSHSAVRSQNGGVDQRGRGPDRHRQPKPLEAVVEVEVFLLEVDRDLVVGVGCLDQQPCRDILDARPRRA